jgi:predicted HTH transcriptional regulator
MGARSDHSQLNMNLSSLHTLLAACESLTLEPKKTTAEKDRACLTLCALANGHGRAISFGVTPAGKVVGQRVADCTLEELAQESKPWNPWIEKVFHRRGLNETWGRGVLKMAGLMQDAGLQLPTMVVQGDCVMLTCRLGQSSRSVSADKTPRIGSKKSSEKILSLLWFKPELSAKAVDEQLVMSSRAVEKQIGIFKMKATCNGLVLPKVGIGRRYKNSSYFDIYNAG